MVIDAHQHFWKYHPQKHAWINDEMAVLKRDFLPPDLEPLYREHGIDGCVAVQAEQSEAETEFLLALAEQFDFIRGVVGWVDLRAKNIESRLAYYSRFDKLKGFRHIVQDEPGPGFMLQPEFLRGLGLLHRYGFTYDILIYPTQLDAALKVVERFPEQRFVVDHIAKPYIKAGGGMEQWAAYMKAIGSHANTYCKVSGLVTEADWRHWKAEDIFPFLDVVFEAFRPGRLMFGSDWPVCLLAASYGQVKGILEQYTEALSGPEKIAVWGGSAAAFYGL
ncbi:MAG: amidohydrolase family protein [Phaeodactylibacter sp.]|nr:amidohydrolase family protein [Phaeodactylibacter sp.]MCB9277225.1 amidohydrolase family protein [Lewinellaceae bacterium]